VNFFIATAKQSIVFVILFVCYSLNKSKELDKGW